MCPVRFELALFYCAGGCASGLSAVWVDLTGGLAGVLGWFDMVHPSSLVWLGVAVHCTRLFDHLPMEGGPPVYLSALGHLGHQG